MLAIDRKNREEGSVMRSAYFDGNLLRPAWSLGFLESRQKKVTAYPQKMWTPCWGLMAPSFILSIGSLRRPYVVFLAGAVDGLRSRRPRRSGLCGVSFRSSR